MLENKIYSLLTGTTIITGIVGTRIYPVIAPQNVTFPFILYTRIAGGQINLLSGYSQLENPRIQIDAFSTGYSQTKTLADNIHTVMNSSTTFKSVLITEGDLFGDDLSEQGAYRVSMDFSCFNQE